MCSDFVVVYIYYLMLLPPRQQKMPNVMISMCLQILYVYIMCTLFRINIYVYIVYAPFVYIAYLLRLTSVCILPHMVLYAYKYMHFFVILCFCAYVSICIFFCVNVDKSLVLYVCTFYKNFVYI